MDRKELYSNQLTKGKRTYFFDIHKSDQDDLYLKITESKKTESGFERHQLLVFSEDLKAFVAVFKETLDKFKEIVEPPKDQSKAYSVEEVRKEHQRAYMPWSQEEDSKLELLFCQGKSDKEIAQIFGRQRGAINSRIRKLELKEKYGDVSTT